MRELNNKMEWLIKPSDMVKSSSGKNTILMLKLEYTVLNIGDNVQLTTRYAADEKAVLIEYLSIKSIAVGGIEDIVEAFHSNNHGSFDTPHKLQEHLRSLYGENTDTTPFIAITFD
jgi:hypothetical protein